MSWLDRFRRTPPGERKSYALYQLMPTYLSWSAKWTQYSNAQALDAYRKSVWLYAAIRLRADNISSVPWVVEVKRAGEWEQAQDHPLIDLLARPNPEQDWPSMMKRAIYWLDLTGDAWFTKVRNGAGKTWHVWSCLPETMEVKTGRDRLVYAWEYHKGTKSETIPAEDVIHLMYSSPDSVYYGLAPLQSASKSVDVDMEAANFQKVTLQNHGMPPGFFKGTDDLTQEQYEQHNKYISEHTGPEHSRIPWVMGGFEYQSMGNTPHELDFILSRKETVKEILSAYCVPCPMVGIYDNTGGLNSEIIKTARQIFWREGLIPVLREIEGQLNLQLAYEYGPDVRITYDLTNIEALEEDQGAKIERARSLWGMGVPLEQINTVLELGLDTDEIEGADVGYLPSGLLPANFDMGESEPMSDESTRATYGEEEKPEPTAPAGPAPEEPVANTAMNGAQVTALQAIVQSVADTMLPPETAIQLILVSFPTITQAQARAMIAPLASFEQAKPEPPPNNPPPIPPKGDNEDEEDAT